MLFKCKFRVCSFFEKCGKLREYLKMIEVWQWNVRDTIHVKEWPSMEPYVLDLAFLSGYYGDYGYMV